jgi:nondiscriminating aspartyl-tRNA synthetase
MRTLVRDLTGKGGEAVTLLGWVAKVRDQKSVQFVVLRDETGEVQIVHDRGSDYALAAQISALSAESVVRVAGTVELNDRVRLGGLEVRLRELEVLSQADPALPISDETNLDRRLDWRFLDLRRPRNRLVFEIQTAMEASFRRTWREDGFIELHSPKLMASASESGAELFTMKYFDTTAYLAQSPQFYKQMAMAAGFGRVFEIGPVFRANPSFTARHDTEFTSIDVELSWIESHDDVMDFEERLLARMLADVFAEFGDRIRDVFGVEPVVPERPFPRVTLDEAHDVIAASGHKVERAGGDLDPEGERRVAEAVRSKHGHEFVFVTDYPTSVRPFYHMRYDDRPTVTRSFDLLWKGLEVTTGAQREHRHERLAAQAAEKGLSEASVGYYLDFFRYGCPPHGGFGLGLTRLLMILLDIRNVREVTFLYRGPNRLSP